MQYLLLDCLSSAYSTQVLWDSLMFLDVSIVPFTDGYSFYGCAALHLFPYSGFLGCLQVLAVTNKAAMNIRIQVFVSKYAFTSFGSIARNRMAGSYSRFLLNFLGNCQTCFHSGISAPAGTQGSSEQEQQGSAPGSFLLSSMGLWHNISKKPPWEILFPMFLILPLMAPVCRTDNLKSLKDGNPRC